MATEGKKLWAGDGILEVCIWKGAAGSSRWKFETNESFTIFSGRMTEDGGQPLEFTSGDSAILPKGRSGVWELHETSSIESTVGSNPEFRPNGGRGKNLLFKTVKANTQRITTPRRSFPALTERPTEPSADPELPQEPAMTNPSFPRKEPLDHPDADPLPNITDQVNQYRAERRRRRLKANNARRHDHTPSQKDQVLHLASIWAPYGEPPPDEIFERFGITPRHFADRVRQSLQKLDSTSTAKLSDVYPERPGRPRQ